LIASSDKRSTSMSTDENRPTTDRDDVSSDGPDGGPSMSGAGAMPNGSEEDWTTAMAQPDATGSGAVTGTVSKAMPGEKNHAERAKAAKVLTRD